MTARQRHGVTLIELLVAMVIAGLVVSFVAQWIVSSARQSNESMRTADQQERRALLQNELYQDGHRWRTRRLTPNLWVLDKPATDSGRDSVVWEFLPNKITRNQSLRLANDSLHNVRLTPLFPAQPGLNLDPFRSWDRDWNGVLEDSELDSLRGIQLDIFCPNARWPQQIDSLSIKVLSVGPG